MKAVVHRPGVRMECDSVSNKRGLIEPHQTSGELHYSAGCSLHLVNVNAAV